MHKPFAFSPTSYKFPLHPRFLSNPWALSTMSVSFFQNWMLQAPAEGCPVCLPWYMANGSFINALRFWFPKNICQNKVLFWSWVKRWRSQPPPTIPFQVNGSPFQNSPRRPLRRTCLSLLCTMGAHQPAGCQERSKRSPFHPPPREVQCSPPQQHTFVAAGIYFRLHNFSKLPRFTRFHHVYLNLRFLKAVP